MSRWTDARFIFFDFSPFRLCSHAPLPVCISSIQGLAVVQDFFRRQTIPDPAAS